MAHMMNIYLSNLIYIACTIIDENYNLIMSHPSFGKLHLVVAISAG